MTYGVEILDTGKEGDMTYGVEILDIGKEGVNLFENSHMEASKIIQGLPKQSVGIGSLSTIGWNSIEAYIDV